MIRKLIGYAVIGVFYVRIKNTYIITNSFSFFLLFRQDKVLSVKTSITSIGISNGAKYTPVCI